MVILVHTWLVEADIYNHYIKQTYSKFALKWFAKNLAIEKKLNKFLQSYICEDYQISNFQPKFTLSTTLTIYQVCIENPDPRTKLKKKNPLHLFSFWDVRIMTWVWKKRGSKKTYSLWDRTQFVEITSEGPFLFLFLRDISSNFILQQPF